MAESAVALVSVANGPTAVLRPKKTVRRSNVSWTRRTALMERRAGLPSQSSLILARANGGDRARLRPARAHESFLVVFDHPLTCAGRQPNRCCAAALAASLYRPQAVAASASRAHRTPPCPMPPLRRRVADTSAHFQRAPVRVRFVPFNISVP